MKSNDALMCLSALSQETRLVLFRRLVKSGPDGENAGALADVIGAPASTLSFHLKELERAGLIAQRRDGRNIIYTASYDRMRKLLAYLMKDCCDGKPEICGVPLAKACCDA